jgi:diguanylate cyclase (GGDEF)-like protein
MAALRWLAAAWLGAVLALGAGVAAAQAPATAPIALQDTAGPIDAQPRSRIWIDDQGTATLAEVMAHAAAGRMTPPPSADAMYRLGPTAALWLHLRVERKRDDRQEWVLGFPMPVLDLVTVYQRDQAGWHADNAGDTIAVHRWPEGGRYPMFRLDVSPGEVRDVYVRIRHTTSANFPMHLTTASAHAQRNQIEYLALGGAFGALLLLIAACFAFSWVYRDRIFMWYALYAVVTSLAVASYTGAAAHLLWPGFEALRDAPMPMLAAAATGAAMLFVRDLIGLRRRHRIQDRLVHWLGLGGLALALLPPLVPKMVMLHVLGSYMAFSTLTMVAVSLAAWRRGDVVGKWVAAAYLPMTLSVITSFFRIFGWVPVSAGSQYAVVIAMAWEVPLLLVALFIRSRDRHSAVIREQALITHDALTGLLAPHLFQDRLRQVVARQKREGESAAVMFIDLVNHARIKEYFGGAVAEQSLLRSVIKLRRLVRDVDTVARLGEARFGVILEGASARSSVTDRAARLIAAGLMPLPGLKPDVTLQFHIAALMLNERSLDAAGIEAALAGQLARMSSRTRRPIRFIVPEVPEPEETGHDSSLFAQDSDSRRSRPPLTAVS